MIPRTLKVQQPAHWQTLLSQCVTDPEQLLRALELPLDLLPPAVRAARQFRLRVPRGFLARMHPGDPADPLLRQVLPLGDELLEVPGYSADPLAEVTAMPAPGVLHKYRGRVLLTVTGACAVHCRYCFRRHYPYNDANPIRVFGPTIDYLQRHTDIREAILSGGDPLTMADTRLTALVGALESVPHLDRLRIHSRVPVVLPQRVESALLEWISGTRLQVVLVIHTNHANEIDASVSQAMRRLRQAGVTLLNQSVLLRGVNDDSAALVDLSETLFASDVLPYYLHQLDPVRGAAHFQVGDREAADLLRDIRARLPGYLVPRLVRECAGEAAKTPL